MKATDRADSVEGSRVEEHDGSVEDSGRAGGIRAVVRGWLIGVGVFIVAVLTGMGFAETAPLDGCGAAFAEPVSRNLEVLTRPGPLPEPGEHEQACARQRLGTQLSLYTGIQLGLVAIAAGALLRSASHRPTSRPRDGVSWLRAGFRAAMILLPAMLLAGEAVAVVTTEAHPARRLAGDGIEGKHRRAPLECQLLPTSIARDLVPDPVGFTMEQRFFDGCTIEIDGPEESDTTVRVTTPYNRSGTHGATWIGHKFREACGQAPRPVPGACLIELDRDGDRDGWTRTIALRDRNVLVLVDLDAERREVLSDVRMRDLTTTVWKRLTQ